MNPWHDVEPGKRAPEVVDCIIEVPRGSRNKYELDKKSGLLRLDRVLYSAVFYPANYGFIPRTYSDDNDPLDILVLGQEQVVPMCIVTARPIGIMQMVDENEEDDKIIAIHEHDPAFAHYRDISHLSEHTLNELQRFFEDYKILEHKKVRIERFLGRIDAHNVIAKSLRLYEEQFGDDYRSTPAGPTAAQIAEKAEEPRDSRNARVPSLTARVEAARRAATYLINQDHAAEIYNPISSTAVPEYSEDVNSASDSSAANDSLDGSQVVQSAGDSNDADVELERVTIDDHTLNAHALSPSVTSSYKSKDEGGEPSK